MQIIPTILEKNFLEAERKIKLVKDKTAWIQIDVIDGFFTENKTFELELLTRIEGIEKNLLDVHLMVKNPIKWINKCVFVQASRIIGHVENMEDRSEFVRLAKNEGMEAGLAFDIDTEIDKKIPKETDVVLLLGRKAGFGDYSFDEKIYKKIEELMQIKRKNGLNFLIGVDGGINRDNILRLRDVDIDIAYCGGAIFKGESVEENLKYLKND